MKTEAPLVQMQWNVAYDPLPHGERPTDTDVYW